MSCPQPYTWRKQPNGDRTCTHCGSLHPEDMIDIMYRFIAREEGYNFETTDKGYKVYANRGGVQNASQGGIKFYGWHVDDEHKFEFDAAWKLAVPVSYQRHEEKRQQWLADMKKRFPDVG